MDERPLLTPARRDVLAAAAARILPSDDGPGAAEAGVVEYILRALSERTNRDYCPLFERGLDFFQVLAQARKSQDFVSCSGDDQDVILGEAQMFPNNDARRFFERLIQLCLEGFLCDPRHGGNRDYVGWRFLGFSPGAVELGNCQRTL